MDKYKRSNVTPSTGGVPNGAPAEAAASLPAMFIGMQRELELLGRVAERQFMEMGERLQDFHGRARQVANQAKEASGLLAGGGGTEAFGQLQALLQGIDREMQVTVGEAQGSTHALAQLGVQLGALEAPLAGLAKIVKILTALSFSTRVESAQSTEDNNLGVLADDLKGLGTKVGEKILGVGTMVETMTVLSGQASAKVLSVQLAHSEQGRTIVGQAQTMVTDLADHARRSCADTGRVTMDSADISRCLGEIVVSIQFHDITRQQIEHVRSALDEVGRELKGALGPDGEPDLSICGGFVLESCRVQSAQLKHSRDELVTAVETIIGSLRALATNVFALAKDTRRLAGAAQADDANLFTEFEPVIATVTGIFASTAAANRESLLAVETLLQAMTDLDRFLEQIDLLGTEMKMIAFNAGIRAAHNRERGAALGVIAESIQQLSGQVLRHTEEFSSGFHSLMAFARQLAESARATQTAVQASNDLKAGSAELFTRLRQLSDNLIRVLTSMDQLAHQLAGDIEAVAAAISVHGESALIIDQVRTQLDRVMAKVQQHPAHGQFTGQVSGLGRLDRNYTMQSERQIHQQISETLGRWGNAQPQPAREAISAGRRAVPGQEFGDNVELF